MAPPVARFAGQGEGPQPSGSIVPFIHVKSLPPGASLNLSKVVEGLSGDFAGRSSALPKAVATGRAPTSRRSVA